MEWECFLVKPREDNKVSESKMAVSESKMAEFKMAAIIKLSQNEWVTFFVKNGWIQDGRIQDGCHHQVKGEWMSLSQIELVWVRVRVEWECFWVNLREDNKVSESTIAVSEFKMAEFKVATIIKLSQNEWVKFFCVLVGREVWVKFFLCKWWEPILASLSLRGNTKMAESKMEKF